VGSFVLPGERTAMPWNFGKLRALFKLVGEKVTCGPVSLGTSAPLPALNYFELFHPLTLA
jgi:hypothetical protein